MRKKGMIRIIVWLLAVFIYCYPLMVEAMMPEYIRKDIQAAAMISQFNNQLPLGWPDDLYLDSQGNLYVLDLYHQAIFIYDHQYQGVMRLDAVNGLKKPIAVAADEKGNIYVSDAQKGILVFNSIGRVIKTIDLGKLTDGQVIYPTDLMLDKAGQIYLATGTKLGVLILNADGKLKAKIIPIDVLKEGGSPEVVSINRLTIDARERIYLMSEEVGRIYVYERPDAFLFRFGQKGGSIGKLSRPVGIAVDSANELIYVVDYMRHAVSIYNLEGVFLQEYGGSGKDAGWFNHPNQICIDNKQQLLIADTFNHRIQILAVVSR